MRADRSPGTPRRSRSPGSNSRTRRSLAASTAASRAGTQSAAARQQQRAAPAARQEREQGATGPVPGVDANAAVLAGCCSSSPPRGATRRWRPRPPARVRPLPQPRPRPAPRLGGRWAAPALRRRAAPTRAPRSLTRRPCAVRRASSWESSPSTVPSTSRRLRVGATPARPRPVNPSSCPGCAHARLRPRRPCQTGLLSLDLSRTRTRKQTPFRCPPLPTPPPTALSSTACPSSVTYPHQPAPLPHLLHPHARNTRSRSGGTTRRRRL